MSTPSARSEARSVLGLACVLAALRVAYAFAYPFDSDEPQHLHVAWAWTRGLLPYRDVFDNHAPLFHLLSAPLLAWAGETPRILIVMRLAMIPLFGASLWGACLVGRRLFGWSAGAWAALLCGLSPTFFFKTVEYRPDVLWAALWTLGIAVLLGPGRRPARGFAGGLLLGACLAISLKSVMLLAALGIAAAGVLLLSPRRDEGRRLPPATYLVSIAFGIVLPAALFVGFFAGRGALRDLLYGTVQHNLLPGVGRWGYSKRILLLAPILALLLYAARLLMRRFREGAPAAFVLLLAGSQYLLLSTVWPVHTRQDLLPFYPLFTPLLAGVLLLPWWRSIPSTASARPWLLPAALACIELAVLPCLASPLTRGTAGEERLLREVLALTDPTDTVIDLKGQAVYRTRPFYYALETMTLERMARGLIPDTIPERCIAARTCVALGEIGGFPPRARRFLQDNYVVVGSWRVAGRLFEPSGGDPAPVVFDIVIKARYALLREGDGPAPLLDGRPFEAARELEAGRHEFVAPPQAGRSAIVWAQAAERGFSPFRPWRGHS